MPTLEMLHSDFIIENNIDRIERGTNGRQTFWDEIRHNILKTIRRGESCRSG